MEGYIKVHRQILESSVFTDEKALKIWIWCLCKANFKDSHAAINIGAGKSPIKVKRGQFVFGRYKAEEELDMSGSLIYRKIQKFEKEGMIEVQSNNHFTLISIVNWPFYQDSVENLDSQRTSIGQASDNERSTIEQQSDNHRTLLKNDKKEENGNKEKKVKKVIAPPELEFFLDHCKSVLKEKFAGFEFALKNKYQAWVDAGWKDGHGNKIKNWKLKINNTIPFLRPMRIDSPAKTQEDLSKNLKEKLEAEQ